MMDYLMVMYALWVTGFMVMTGIATSVPHEERMEIGYGVMFIICLLSWYGVGKFIGEISQNIDKLKD